MITFNKLFQYMSEHDISRKQLSELTGISQSHIQTIRNNGPVSLTTIDRLCQGLKLKPNDILEYTPEENSAPPFSDQAPSV